MSVGEALLRPALALLLAATVPFATARLLAWVYLADLPAAGEERARRLVPFRRAAVVMGVGQIQLAWMVGATSLGPVFVAVAGSPGTLAFGALAAVVAFAAGGVARRVEEPSGDRSSILGTIALRLRLVPFFLGPVIVAVLAASLPLVRGREVGWPWVAVAFVVVVLGVAFGGLLASVATLAVLPARAETRALAREVAAREGVQLPFVLRLPTVGVRFANAAAVPWARTIVVADRMEQLLDRDALRAVLAHEAGHMSEGPQVAAARVGSVGILLFVVAVGPVVALTLPGAAGWAVLAAGALAGVLLLLTARRLARRMEKRADARAAETVGAAPLARALRALHANGQMPMVTGRRRVHPDLYDRLVALGEDVGPRPPPPPRGGTLLGVAIAITLVAAPVIVHAVTDVSADEVRNVRGSRAAWRLFVDPWDGEALLAAAWHARADGALDRAFELASFAERAGADAWSRHVLLSELHAATGECDAARAAFEASLAAQADRLFHQGLDGAHLELGAYALPPSLVRECDLTVGDAFGGDAHFRMPLE